MCRKPFASAAQLLGYRSGYCTSNEKKIDWFLPGITHDDFDNNVILFFLSKSNHLFPFPTVFVNFFSFVHVLFDH